MIGKWVELVDGCTVPTQIEERHIGPSDTGRKRRALRLPNGSIYTRYRGAWGLYFLGYGEKFVSAKGGRR